MSCIAMILFIYLAFITCNSITWEIGNYPLPVALENGIIFSYDDSISYFFSGSTRNSNNQWIGVNTIYKLDINSNTPTPGWELLSVTMPLTNIRKSDAVKVGEMIYFYSSGTFFVFDTTTDTFLTNNIATNPYDGSSSSASTDGINYIYLTGGQGAISQYIVSYDISNNEWSLLSNTAPLSWFWLNTMYYTPLNRIYVFGGYESSAHFQDIYYFDIDSNSWSNIINTMTLTGTDGDSVYIPEIDTIYIIETYWSAATKVNSYKPISNTIVQETPRPYLYCTSGTAATTLNGRLQLFGGYWNGNTVQDKNCRTEELYTREKLILRHKSTSAGLFNPQLYTTGLENVNDLNANTYSIIGNINSCDYKSSIDNKYQFKLIYHNSDGSTTILIWKQLSWLTDAYITGYEEISVPQQTQCPIGSGCRFTGLGGSNIVSTYLDGDGVLHNNWYNAVGITQAFGGYIPAFNGITAVGQELYVTK